MTGRYIEEDLFVKESIIDPNLPEGKKIHDFLMSRARALAGKHIDFDKYPVTFVLSDNPHPDAFFSRAPDPDHKPDPDRDYTVHYIKNPLSTNIICVSKGLIDMAETQDELDYVLGHELTHMIMRIMGVDKNSKGEEEIADLHAVDLMYDAGSDPKQSLIINNKFAAYIKEHKRRLAEKQRKNSSHDEKEHGINWTEIFDVHMTEANRLAGLEASLTRLSHLIDDREPTPLDKSIFDAYYEDPVDRYLKSQNFSKQKPIGQLKILIDCIEHIGEYQNADDFFNEQFASFDHEDPKAKSWRVQNKKHDLKKAIEEGKTSYFEGPTINKHLQQKIAHMAEAIIVSAERDRNTKRLKNKPQKINTKDLLVYVHDKAYAHINKHGYPEPEDNNYLNASGVLYTYFHALCSTHVPGTSRWGRSENITPSKSKPQIDIDIENAKQLISDAKSAEEFQTGYERLNQLLKITDNIKSIERKPDARFDEGKLDNLSGLRTYHLSRDYELGQIYMGEFTGGETVPWQNLYDIAQQNPQTKDTIVQFLKTQGTEDFRLSHNLPYMKCSHDECFTIDENGKLSDEKIPHYELDFATNKETVLAAYAYIKDFFEKEDTIVNATCDNATSIRDEDFKTFKSDAERNNERSKAHENLYALISMFNALPDLDEKEDEDSEYFRGSKIIPLIPRPYMDEHPMPAMKQSDRGFNEDWRSTVDERLFDHKNPIFIEHFGENYREELLAKKEELKQKMFAAILEVLDVTIDMWLVEKPKLEAIRKKQQALFDEAYNSEDEEFKKSKWEERRALDNDEHSLRKQCDTLENLLHNILFSVFRNTRYGASSYKLNRLNNDQAEELARYAVNDEKGALIKLFKAERYEEFCDFLKILHEQTDRVIEGNFEWTDMIKVVANSHGYTRATTPEEFKEFVEKFDDVRSREEEKYSRYLHIFDVMQYLGNNDEININALAIAIQKIEQSEDRNGRDRDSKILKQNTDNYERFVQQSQLLPLLMKAVKNKNNYSNLSTDEALETMDSLADVRTQFAKLLGTTIKDPKTYKEDIVFEAKHQELFDTLDTAIYNLIAQTEKRALNNQDALEKTRTLFRLYTPERRRFSSGSERQPFVNKLIKDDKKPQEFAALANDKTFWPDDVLDHVKAYVFAKKTFLDDKQQEDKILNDILAKLENTPAGKKKNECLFALLDQKMRAAYPETRERLFDIYVADVSGKLGADDASEKYQSRLGKYLTALETEKEKDWDIGSKHGSAYNDRDLLSNSIAAADKYVLLRKLSDRIVSQEITSEMMKKSCQANLNSEDLARSYLYGIGIDTLTEKMDRDADTAKKFIAFLNSKGEQSDCEEISDHIKDLAEKEDWHGKDHVIYNTKPTNCKILYENFWSAPLEARSLITARMLKSSVTEKKKKGKNAAPEAPQNKEGWERVFDVVMDNLIKPEDESIEAKYARDIMHSYIKSRSDYERELILSAMMVANRNIGEDAGNVGKALKLFLENMGPAEIKLGQAIASHPDTPESIRAELQGLKSSARMPARWTVYDWIKNENIPEELWKEKYLGHILGAASYYTTVELGDDEVLRLLVPEAREKAAKGFKVIGNTIIDLRGKDESSDLDYAELTTSVQEMVTQAARMSHIETDHKIGAQQYKDAKDIYNGAAAKIGDARFTFKVMDWKHTGQNWIILNKAKGPTFNAMPAETPAQLKRKKQFAIGYIVFEIQNILSGKKFDHDKHGDQLSIDDRTNEAGIYDTGAMALRDPTPDEQRLLGHVLYDVIKNSLKNAFTEAAHPFASIGKTISNKIDDLHAQGIDTQYLVEVKKGLLALGDFFRVLDDGDMPAFMDAFDMNSDVSKYVRQGLEEKMSIMEKAQFKAFWAVQSAKRHRPVIIERGRAEQTPANVNNYEIAPTIPDKASWLKTAFRDSKKPKGKSRGKSGTSHLALSVYDKFDTGYGYDFV